MKKITLTIVSVMLGALIASGAQATVPELIPVQGVLTDDLGEFVDGSTSMTFAVYDTETATSSIWTETQTVDVDEGFFTAYLGSVTALVTADLVSPSELWLGVTVESDDEMDRVQFAAVPFAIEAQRCQQVGNLTESDIFSTETDLTTLLDDNYAPTAHNHDSDYAPISHNHDSDYAPISHTHAWSDLTSVPAGFADGVDNDTNAETICADGSFLNGDGTCDQISLNRTRVAESVTIAAYSSASATATCPSGYVGTGGNCNNVSRYVELDNSYPGSTSHTYYCNFYNNSGTSRTAYVNVVCVQIQY